MSNRAAIFPGQGAQLVGMGKDVADAYPAAAEVFDRADAVLGFSLSSLCFEGPAERLDATDIQQPAIFTTSVALYRAGEAAGVFSVDAFAALGGLSLGEYTALHVAGAMPFEEALRLVARRGELMQQAAEATPGGMVSIIGADEETVLSVCERVADRGRVQPANFNCPGQIVISGDRAACEAAVQLADEVGCRMIALPVAGAFHSEHMRPAAEGLKPALAACPFEVPRQRVIANVDADYHRDPDGIRASLYRQVINPVMWQACIERMMADGCDAFWEIGPNRHLTGMMRKINRKMKAVNLSGADSLAAAKE
jgi:[acyl-carrier-protein] S-malonyltransferase